MCGVELAQSSIHLEPFHVKLKACGALLFTDDWGDGDVQRAKLAHYWGIFCLLQLAGIPSNLRGTSFVGLCQEYVIVLLFRPQETDASIDWERQRVGWQLQLLNTLFLSPGLHGGPA